MFVITPLLEWVSVQNIYAHSYCMYNENVISQQVFLNASNARLLTNILMNIGEYDGMRYDNTFNHIG